ncbi:MAG: clostripain-related cysteine peptidase [Bacillota bacterium]
MRKLRSVLMLLIVIALIVFTSGCGGRGSVEGYVYAGMDLLPVSGAKVVCTGTKTSAQTDVNGYFRIDNIKVGAQKLTVTDGSTSTQKSVTIVKDQLAKVSVVFQGSLPLNQKEWTILVYMASDNNLHYEGLKDLNEMKKVGSNEQLNVVVQYDGWSNGDSERLYIKSGEALSLEPLGEVDMSLGTTLEEFVKWGLTNFPAENTMLVLWNHGGGVWPRSIGRPGMDGASGGGARASGVSGVGGGGVVQPSGVAWDDSSGVASPWDCLTVDELRIALSKAYSAVPDSKIDIIDFDACLMQMYEVCLELEGLADYIVGSEEVTPGGGNPYTDILTLLEEDPDMTPADFACGVAEEFMDYYDKAVGLYNGLVQSVVKISGQEWEDFKVAMDAFGTELAGLGVDELRADELQHFRNKVAGYYVFEEDVFAGDFEICPVLRFEYPENADLKWMLQTILSSDNAALLPSLQTVAADLLDKLDGIVISAIGMTGESYYGPGSYEGAGGLAILMPCGYDEWSSYKGSNQYVKLKVGNTPWYNVVQNIVPQETSGESLKVELDWNSGNLDLYVFEPHGSWYCTKSFASSTPNGKFTADVSSPNASTSVKETYTLNTDYEAGTYRFYVYCESSYGEPINAVLTIKDGEGEHKFYYDLEPGEFDVYEYQL